MHNRQSGAAHVPIMFFLILMVMFIGAVGFAFVQTDKNTGLVTRNAELLAENDQLKGKNLHLIHYAEDLGAVLKLPGKYEARANINVETAYKNQSLDDVTGIVNPSELKKKMGDLGAAVDLAVTNGVDDLFAAVVTKMKQKDSRITEAELARDSEMTKKSEFEQQLRQANSEHAREAQQWAQNMEQRRADGQAQVTQRDGTIAGLQENVRNAQDELLSEREARAEEKKFLQNEIAKLEMHNDALSKRDQLRNPISLADGAVIVAKPGLPNAFINLGRKDMLQPGTMFRIKNRNSDAIKGYAEVIRVEQDKAEVRLSSVVDELGDPIREGDQIFNDLYSPGKYNKRVIYLMGRFSYPYNKPQLIALLESLGNTVVYEMKPGVDTVLLGNSVPTEEGDGEVRIEDTDEYKLAMQLGVEFAPLRKVRDLIKL